MVKLLQRSHYCGRTTRRSCVGCMDQETKGMDIRPVEICTLVWWVQIRDFWFQWPCFCETGKVEGMVSTCVVPTVKHGGGGVILLGCFTGDAVGDLFKIQGSLNQHCYRSILQRHAIPKCFQSLNWYCILHLCIHSYCTISTFEIQGNGWRAITAVRLTASTTVAV